MNDTSNDKASTACIFINTQISERLSNPTVTLIFFFLFLIFWIWNVSRNNLTWNKWKQDAGRSYWRRRPRFNSWWLRRRQPERPSSVFTPSVRQPTETMTSPFSSLSDLPNQRHLHPVLAAVPPNDPGSFWTRWRESSPWLLTSTSRTASRAIKVMHISTLWLVCSLLIKYLSSWDRNSRNI